MIFLGGFLLSTEKKIVTSTIRISSSRERYYIFYWKVLYVYNLTRWFFLIVVKIIEGRSDVIQQYNYPWYIIFLHYLFFIFYQLCLIRVSDSPYGGNHLRAMIPCPAESCADDISNCAWATGCFEPGGIQISIVRVRTLGFTNTERGIDLQRIRRHRINVGSRWLTGESWRDRRQVIRDSASGAFGDSPGREERTLMPECVSGRPRFARVFSVRFVVCIASAKSWDTRSWGEPKRGGKRIFI